MKQCWLLLALCLSAKFSWANEVKLVTLAPHIVENLYSIGAGDLVIATSEHSDYPPAAQAIPRVGNYAGVSIEKVLSLAPDYVIAWRNGSPPADVARLQSLGLNVRFSDPKTPADVADELLWLGQLSGHSEQAKIQAQKVTEVLKRIEKKYQNSQPINVFYQLWSAPLTTVSNQAWPNLLLKKCGVNNVFDQLTGDYPQISAEHVLVKNPDMIIIPTSGAEPNGQKQAWLKYRTLKAVKTDAIFYVNSDRLHRMTARAVVELERMCQQIHALK